ncbi:MAG: hypothetical protein DWQ47_10030 [Acidobacteria bacterium]|nr:MAG: hypothetical protein DWQ32_12445 [Acidobacteriota bacterium]REJ98672.1 MAG: hypothetical protein DWQ38_15035 [Acidobacteriota bacterium]REK16672.1 MAG: hypothetical protein DWQ43_00290 [Acidobacteriota bacterium]REK42583.1 MAG: hypothetical protein DWQ47_10030 [Acidobacteriota bacterium]
MKSLSDSLLACLMLLALASTAFPCACCAERGTYFSSTSGLDDFERGILANMEYAPESSMYLDEAGFEVISGVDPLREIYESSETAAEFDKIKTRVSVSSNLWTFTLSVDETSGALTLPFPAEREYYAADIHDGRRSSGGGPLLYKELRFKGKVSSGSGMFSAGLKKGADYILVFQGRGNGCNNVEDFTHWRLSVNGPDSRYSFFGRLPSGKVEEIHGGVGQALPKFQDHATELWPGTPKPVDLNSHRNARTFRTRLKQARNEGINFAGRYIFANWGCGTNCLVGAVIDATTGKVYFPEQMAGLGVGLPGTDIEAEALEYQLNSSMFIVRGALAGSDEVGTHFLLWENNEFRRIRYIP